MLSWVPYTRKRQHSNLQSEVNSASFQSEWVTSGVTARWFIAWLVRGVLTSSRFPSLAWVPPALRLEIDYNRRIFHSRCWPEHFTWKRAEVYLLYGRQKLRCSEVLFSQYSEICLLGPQPIHTWMAPRFNALLTLSLSYSSILIIFPNPLHTARNIWHSDLRYKL